MNPSDMRQIFTKYKALYVNRVHRQGRQNNNEGQRLKECTFKPQKCKSNERLKRHWQGKKVERLIDDRYLMRSSEDKYFDECTFQPNSQKNGERKMSMSSRDKCRELY